MSGWGPGTRTPNLPAQNRLRIRLRLPPRMSGGSPRNRTSRGPSGQPGYSRRRLHSDLAIPSFFSRWWSLGQESNLRVRELQSRAFPLGDRGARFVSLSGAHSGLRTRDLRVGGATLCRLSYVRDVWSRRRGSNPRPPRSKRGALPTELRRPGRRGGLRSPDLPLVKRLLCSLSYTPFVGGRRGNCTPDLRHIRPALCS